MFLHLLRACSDENSSRNDRFLSEVIFASIDMVLRGIPRKVSEVVGPSIYDSVSESSGPTAKKLLTTAVALLIAVMLLIMQ